MGAGDYFHSPTPINPNVIPVIFRMKITNMSKPSEPSFNVLYNPNSYSLQRSTKYSEKAGLDSNMPSIQFISGTVETLKFELYLDSFSSAAEIGGSALDRAKFAGNSLLPSIGKQIDIRKYTSKIYDLMLIVSETHAPALVKIEWSSLQFEGHLVDCRQEFIKFNERGLPVRAKLHCTFQRYVKTSEIAEMKPFESPDTTKYRTLSQGDSLWSHASREYGQCDQWREIARANGIVNPRQIDTGSIIKVPAL